MTCPTCLGRTTLTNPNATEREWLEGLREEACPACNGSGLDKTRLEAAAKALYTYRYNPSGWEKDDNPLRESLTNQAGAAIRAYLDHTEETR